MIEAFASLLRYAAPVGVAALGETVGQKSGVINVGLEGLMITASYSAMVTTQATGSVAAGVAAGVLSAVILAAVQAYFTLRLASDQVVVGTAVNLLGLGLTGTLYRIRYGTSGQLLSVPKIPLLPGGFDAVLLFWIAAVIVVTWLLFRTKWGLVLRATGEFPSAVVASGFKPLAMRLQASLINGAFAGLAGAYLALGVAGSFAENMTAGRGFVALAMVTFGRWKPVWVFLASLLIGYADSLQFELQARRVDLPPQIFLALPYVLALAVLVVVGKGTSVPSNLAQPYTEDR